MLLRNLSFARVAGKFFCIVGCWAVSQTLIAQPMLAQPAPLYPIPSQPALAKPELVDDAWFEDFKTRATDAELYTFLYAMPKGGDLHNHMSGSVLSEWMYELALAQKAHGYIFYTKVNINNCRAFGNNEFGRRPYLLLFHNLLESSYEKLPDCEKAEYKPLAELNEKEKAGWLDSIRLNHEHEGRDEFFQTHWQRMDELLYSPYMEAEMLYRNMQAFGAEGLIYLESMMGSGGFRTPDGKPIANDEVVDIYRKRLQQADAKATGVTVRLQESILRFAPNAELQLIRAYELVARHRDLYVAVNMVGREDNDKGYPLRFAQTLRDLRKKYNNVRLSVHAGEVDEPNYHIRDTLLIGADRIGHGVNLISDKELLRQMRHGPYMVEINLISNLLLEYIASYDQHPFPEYLRLGIPVALSTDDRGMWDSNLTDEFFVAVKEYNLSWAELQALSRNSLQYSFVEDDIKQQLLATYERRARQFARQFRQKGVASLKGVKPVSYSFTCKRYQLCDF
ncbi:adenosine deaminase family protein [Cellvibrio japonicus]|uniref:Putative adenosine deaminase n=1 Tax=Cellvibrio japonicus (strain Ueda107) TaxID=498211 RepID=B3PJF8_CELJU|nr:adenosine deaminase [Cellvibrio japonicus]ACE85059.1 putative adenosine deaminase [Cellvibrio japonicus Ueda107]